MARDAFRGPAPYVSPLADESPLLGVFDPERAFELTTPTGTGARLIDVATPEEREAGIRAATDAERARRVAEARRTPSVRASEDLAAELQSDPRFAFMSHGLDTATMGLDDEIVAAGLAGMSNLGIIEGPELNYRDVQRALDEATAVASEESPWASRAGTVAGIGATLPLTELALPAAATGATGLARLAPALRPAMVGAGLGGIGGALGAEPGDRLSGALRGAATGGIFGGLGGGMATLGRAARAAAPGVMGTIAGGALEGAGYGTLAAPGTMREPITDTSAALRAGTQGLTTGATIGGALGAASNLFTQPARYLSGGGSRVPSQTGQLIPEAPIVDDTAAEFAAMDEASGLQAPTTGTSSAGLSPREAAEAAMAERANRSPLRRLWDETVAADPATKRWHSMGVPGRRDLRSIERGFGSLEAGVQALNEAGLAMPGTTYATRTARAGAQAANEQARSILAGIHERVAASGQPISGANIADEIDRIADSYVTGVQSPRTDALIDALRGRAMDYRYGAGVRPTSFTGEFIDEATGLADEFPVTSLPPELELTYPQLRQSMEQEAQANAPFLSGATVEPTPQQLAARDVYRTLAGERNAAIERAGLMGEYAPSNRIFRATEAVLRSPYEQMAPAEFRSMIGGAASASGPGDLLGRGLGWLRERAIGQYQDSALATLNELGGASREQVYQQAASMVLSSPATLTDDVRQQLQTIASGQIPSGPDAARIFERATQMSTGPGRLAAARARTLVEATDNAPFLLQRFRSLAAVDPEAAGRFAQRVDDLAMTGARIGSFERQALGSEAVEREISAAEREPAPDDSAIRERDRAFGRMLGVTSSEPTEALPETPEPDDQTRERDRSFGARLLGRGR